MLQREKYISMSLEYDLFWVRIMKEHAIFIESSIPPIHEQLAKQADEFKQQYDRLFADTIRIANGAIPKEALQSGQYYTRFTEAAEHAVQQLTGIEVNRNLTMMEYNIEPLNPGSVFDAQKEQEVSLLNEYILNLTSSFARFKSELLNNQISCRLFTFLYSADLDHILREALKYIEVLNALQARNDTVDSNYRQFWNTNMSDHAKSMRGLFDPTETDYFNIANQFVGLYDALMQSSASGMQNAEDLNDAKQISEFKAKTTQGLIECKVRAIMSPLYTDHLLREANHYIYLLQT